MLAQYEPKMKHLQQASNFVQIYRVISKTIHTDGQTGVAHYAFTHSRLLAINPVQNLCPPSSTVYVNLLN
jgi:hypothetical protein